MRRGEPYTPDEIDRIRRMAADRQTDEEIGLLLGRGKLSVGNTRRRHGIPAGGGSYDPAPVDPELVELIRTLTAAGWSDREIGARIDRSPNQITALRNRFGIGPGNPQMGPKVNFGPNQLAAQARRNAHIQKLRAAREARRAAGG